MAAHNSFIAASMTIGQRACSARGDICARTGEFLPEGVDLQHRCHYDRDTSAGFLHGERVAQLVEQLTFNQ
jgi:hypothetical protein